MVSIDTFLSNQTSKYFPIIAALRKKKWIPKGPGFLFRLHKLREGEYLFPLLSTKLLTLQYFPHCGIPQNCDM